MDHTRRTRDQKSLTSGQSIHEFPQPIACNIASETDLNTINVHLIRRL